MCFVLDSTTLSVCILGLYFVSRDLPFWKISLIKVNDGCYFLLRLFDWLQIKSDCLAYVNADWISRLADNWVALTGTLPSYYTQIGPHFPIELKYATCSTCKSCKLPNPEYICKKFLTSSWKVSTTSILVSCVSLSAESPSSLLMMEPWDLQPKQSQQTPLAKGSSGKGLRGPLMSNESEWECKELGKWNLIAISLH